MSFNVGDKVVCKDPRDSLVKGRQYSISSVYVDNDKDMPLVTLVTVEGIDQQYFANRFELFGSAPSSEKFKFKIGDLVKAIDDISGLTKGETYVVNSILDGGTENDLVYVRGVTGGHFDYRFVLADRLPYDAAFEAGRQLGRLEGLLEMVGRIGVKSKPNVESAGALQKLQPGDKVVCVDGYGQSWETPDGKEGHLVNGDVYTVAGDQCLDYSDNRESLVAMVETVGKRVGPIGSFRWHFRKLVGGGL
jgi:hypothetical protein